MATIIDSSKNLCTPLITAPVTLDLIANIKDIGGRFNVMDVSNVALWIKGSRNNSDTVKIRVKCYRNEKDTDASYPQIQTVNSTFISMVEEVYDIKGDLAGNINCVFPLGMSALVPFLQIEAYVDTLGGLPAVINEAYISFDRRS